jgi:glycerophosphoryl diester phosphodiesterase
VFNPQPGGHLLAVYGAHSRRVTTLLTAAPRIVAHRGFSSRQPEMTLAAYAEAIDWSIAEGVALGLECDVHVTADGELVCLHDSFLGRTTNAFGPVGAWTLEDLRGLDFGSWKVHRPSPAQRSVVSLADLVGLVRGGRERGADLELVVETKHPQPRGLELEERVCALLAGCGWLGPQAPVRLITFSVPAAERLARLAPDTDRTLLIETDLGAYADGTLPDGVHVAGLDVALLRTDPGYVARAASHGNEVHAWTANRWADIALCRDLGVRAITSDHPDRVLDVLGRPVGATPPTGTAAPRLVSAA